MATVIKTLRTSGGDFSTMAQVGTYLDSMVDDGKDIFIHIQGGATFSGKMQSTTTGKTGSLTIRTDPTELVANGPAKLQATIAGVVIYMYPPPTIQISELKMDGVDQNQAIAIENGYTAIIENCFFAGGAGYYKVLSFVAADATAVLKFVNNMYATSFVAQILIAYSNAKGTVIFNNNIALTNSANGANWMQYVNVSGATGGGGVFECKNNRAYNYGSGGGPDVHEIWDGSFAMQTITGNVKGNPLCVANMVNSEGEPSSDIIARDCHLTASSPCRDAGDPTYAPAIDMWGKSRA